MRDEQTAFQALLQFRHQCLERWCIRDHLVLDAGQLLDECRNGHAWIDEAGPVLDTAITLDGYDADLRDAIFLLACAGRFQIDEQQFFRCRHTVIFSRLGDCRFLIRQR